MAGKIIDRLGLHMAGRWLGRIGGGVAGAVVLSLMLFSSETAIAGSCPRPCWAELNCCCITPCPVSDSQELAKLAEAVQSVLRARDIYGVRIPGLDSVRSLKSVVDPKSLAAAGLTAMQQGWRNTLRGVAGEQGLEISLPTFAPALMEMEQGLGLPAVHADLGGEGVDSIEELAQELDESYWHTAPVSRDGEDAMRSKRTIGARLEAVDALSYAWVKRSEIMDSVERARALEARLDAATTASDEIRLNAELKALVMADSNRYKEVASYAVKSGAAAYIATRDEEIVKPARESSNAGIRLDESEGPSDTFLFARARSACEVSVRRAVAEHNLLTDINDLQAYLPSLMKTVEDHDARKMHAWNSTNALVATVAALYEDPSSAWARVSGELAALDKTSYMDQGRYARAKAAAGEIAAELLAQKASTRFGKRIINKACTGRKAQEKACYPFATISPGSATWARVYGEINSYYATAERQYDAYNRFGAIDATRMAVKAMPLPPLSGPSGGTFSLNGKKGGGADDVLAERAASLAFNHALAVSQASVMIQYRQEAVKRKLYWDALRRGDDADFGPAIKPELRQELAMRAPSCLYGPAKNTANNLVSLASWFDVDPNCAWREWSSGPYVGERIGHEWLGGTDSAIWAIKNEIVAYNEEHEGRPGVEEWAKGSLGLCQTAASLAPAAGRSDVRPEIDAMMAAARAVLADTGNASRVEITLPASD